MTWWLWVLIWITLLSAAGAIFFVIGRTLWFKAGALFDEIGVATDRLSAVSDGLQQLADRTAEPAVFTPASQLRQERILAGRQANARRPAGHSQSKSRRPGTDGVQKAR